LNGRVFEGKNKNQLFFPADGCCTGSFIYDIGSYCSIWSSNLDLTQSYNAYCLYFASNNVGLGNSYRCDGYSVRPVINL
jgi:hypothetical protein